MSDCGRTRVSWTTQFHGSYTVYCHDKCGNVLYRRTESGEDVVVERIDTVAEIDPQTGNEVHRQIKAAERLIDDELPEVAREYLQWLGEQS